MADSNFSSVAVLAKFTVDGDVTTYTDIIGKTFTGYGNAKVVTSASMLTGHALQLDGAGDYIAATGADVVILGNGVATIDCEVLVSSAGYILYSGGDSNSWGLYVTGAGYVVVMLGGGGVKTGAIAINNGVKHHVALVGKGSNAWSLYIDGVKDGSDFTYGNTFLTTPSYFSIGANNGGSPINELTGYIGYVRVTPGIARWAENFTPPTLADLGAIYAKTMTAEVVADMAGAGAGVFLEGVAEYLEVGSSARGVWFARITEPVTISSTHGATLHAVALLAQGVAVATDVASRVVFGERLDASVVISAASVAKLLASASMASTLRLYTADLNAGDIDDAIETWCANLATEAHSRYAQYGFNSFARFNGKHYGCKSDGVFELGGDTDGASPIPWTVTLAETDFGMNEIKRLSYVYVAAKATGDLVLKVIEGPGAVHFFNIEMSTRETRSGRARIAKGLSGRYWKLEIASDTERVELDSLEFFPVATTRRI